MIYKFNDSDHIQSRVANTDNNCNTIDSSKVKLSHVLRNVKVQYMQQSISDMIELYQGALRDIPQI